MYERIIRNYSKNGRIREPQLHTQRMGFALFEFIRGNMLQIVGFAAAWDLENISMIEIERIS